MDSGRLWLSDSPNGVAQCLMSLRQMNQLNLRMVDIMKDPIASENEQDKFLNDY